MKKLMLLMGILVVAAGCATTPRQSGIGVFQESDLISLCKKEGVQWQWDSLSHVITLKFKDKDAKLIVGSDTVFMDGQAILLSGSIIMRNSSIIVPSDFNKRVISPAQYRQAPEKTQAVRLPVQIKAIIIDAGHGGKDPGAIGKSGVQEKGIVLDISKRLYKILKNKGYEVTLTRRDDTFITLQERTEIASKGGTDLFISVHANSNPKRSIHGLEVYVLRGLDEFEQNETQRRNNQKIMMKNLSMKKDNENVKQILSELMYVHKQSETMEFADYVAETTSNYIRAKNRGSKKARFYVLRNTLIPAVLVEVGYLTNPKEEQLLQTENYRQKIALGLAGSITGYINGKK